MAAAAAHPRRALFVLASDPMMFPPTMNAADILATEGWEVDILGYRLPENPPIHHDARVRIRYLGTQRRRLAAIVQYLGLCAATITAARRGGYRWIFAYDQGAVLPAFLAARVAGIRWLYHNHDLMRLDQLRSAFARLQKRAERRLARRASIVVFPQRERAELFREEAGLAETPLIVFNGPRRGWSTPSPRHPALAELRGRCDAVAVYQGCFGYELHRFLEAVPHCRTRLGVCFVGKEMEPGAIDQYRRVAAELGLADRLLILPPIPYEQLSSITSHCDIGIAKQTSDPDAPLNDYLLAGASNKVAEYMACSLPIIAPDTPLNRRFFVEGGRGLVADPKDPRAVAAAIDRLFSDRALFARISENNGREAREQLSYDSQFAKVLDRLD